ncbi:Glycosyl transferase family 1 domain-containing protein [Bordetella tumbae]|uniref:glycosyltransferase family 4 protein n=1 Tax=Bordetella tumbae TaxID=1649139 RepID=UPI0039EF5669
MRVAYLAGVCVAHDAISNAIHSEVRWLKEAGHEVRLFTYRCDYGDIPHKQVSSLWQVMSDPGFQSADIVVFHFGVYSGLFDLLMVTPRHAKRIVVFHNITPKQFLPPSAAPLIERSFRQMSNIVFADHVVCVSDTNHDVLLSAGITVPWTKLPLAIRDDLVMPASKPSFVDGLPRIVFLGRFVQSKGPGELLEAVRRVLDGNPDRRLQLDLIGNLDFSDQAIIAQVRLQIDALHRMFPERVRVALKGSVADSEKQALLAEADIFALPTYHEGFCVPILEALACGCRVVSYENSNVPAVSGGLASLVPTGDVEALSRALDDALRDIDSKDWASTGYHAYAERAKAHVAQFHPDAVRRSFLRFIERMSGAWRQTAA